MKILRESLPLPMNEEADEFLTALSIGQKIINSKRDYTKCFRFDFIGENN